MANANCVDCGLGIELCGCLGEGSEKAKALAKFLDCLPEDVREDGDTFHAEGGEYIVLTDEEADEMAKEYILDTVWAFYKSFLDGHSEVISEMDDEAFSVIQERCESANGAILAMIPDKDSFVMDAIAVGGRGRFLSQYDGEEGEEGEFFIYRTN